MSEEDEERDLTLVRDGGNVEPEPQTEITRTYVEEGTVNIQPLWPFRHGGSTGATGPWGVTGVFNVTGPGPQGVEGPIGPIGVPGPPGRRLDVEVDPDVESFNDDDTE